MEIKTSTVAAGAADVLATVRDFWDVVGTGIAPNDGISLVDLAMALRSGLQRARARLADAQADAKHVASDNNQLAEIARSERAAADALRASRANVDTEISQLKSVITELRQNVGVMPTPPPFFVFN